MSIDSDTANQNTLRFPLGEVVTEGKTKIIRLVDKKPHMAIVISKDDITAGDGKKHDVIPGKGVWATETTCNVFELLDRASVPLAYIGRDNVNSFIVDLCTMLPYEVVVRREAHGSYLKRNPDAQKGDRFPGLLVEFFLKTSGKEWKGTPLECDDPLMRYEPLSDEIMLYHQTLPYDAQKPFRTLDASDIWTRPDEHTLYAPMAQMAKQAFLVLERAWKIQDVALVDFKVEFGIGKHLDLLLADVIDNDSWRIVKDDAYIDKQRYRDGDDLQAIAKLYEAVAHMTRSFPKMEL